MSLQVKEDLMAPETFGVDIDYTPAVKDNLVDEDGRPRKLWVLVYNADDVLVYPPMLLLRIDGDEEGLHLEGFGALWSLGAFGVGPTISDREYVSGFDKLSNGPFNLGELYWRLASEGSRWLFSLPGLATNAGGLDADDVLESDEKFPTRPGYAYRAEANGVYGAGRLRIRIIFEGRFRPANLWPNGDLATDAGWTTSPYASIVVDPANSYNSTSAKVIRCLPIPKASWTDNFEGGSSWTDVTTPAPMSDDIDIVNEPSQAFDGSWVMRVGPVTQHQVFTNADFGQGLHFWFPSSTDAEPDLDAWQVWPGDGVNGSDGIITAGYATAGRTGPETIKYLRADVTDGGGVDTYDVKPGETYRAECYAAAAPGSEGQAYISIMIPHPTVPAHDIWWKSEELSGLPPNDDWRWKVLNIENLTIPENRFDLNALIEVHNHGLGYWKFDHFTLTRIRGNRAKIVSNTLIPVEADTDYEVSALMRNGDDMQVGNVRVGVELQGPAVETQSEGEDKNSTDFVWDRAARTVRPSTGYTTARFFVAAQDVLGSMWVDHFTLIQLNNNRTSVVGSSFAVTPERTYTVSCKYHSDATLQRGNIRISVRLTRTGHPDVTVPSSVQDGTAGDRRVLSFTMTPPSGYATGTATVTFTDIEGGMFYAGAFSVVDNDTGSVVYDALSDDPTGFGPYVDATAPDGAESVRVAVVAESDSSGWIVDGVSLKRTGVTPATGAAIVADLLTDPETGLPLSLSAGTINAPAVIPYDWVIQNQTNRAALDHLCAVVYDGGLEYRVNATAPATIDVAPSADLFTDHSPDSDSPITLLPEDIDVVDLDDPEVDVSERATVIRLFGAERQTVSGRPFLITADAEVPGAVEYDYNGRAIVRVKPVSDGTVDHHGYAQAYADDLALRESEPALNLSAKLSGRDTRPPFSVGDWLYVYHPEAGLEDPDNVQEIEGLTVFPRRVRVLSRERAHGPSYRIVMRRSDGTTFDLPGVRHSPEDATVLTIGDRLPEFVVDPQGASAGQQYMKDRASRPR